jgi:signal transduction histidine kinase
VLADWLEQQDQYEVVPGDHAVISEADFDVCIIDERSLHEHAAELRTQKIAANAFLPVLLVTSNASGASSVTPDSAETAPKVWQVVDELLPTPIDTVELQRRLDTLTRIRTQSIALKRKTDQLLLLNRVTRHDIRNDMNVISGWTEQLAGHTDGAGEEIRQRVLDSSQHVVDLTKAVREFVDTLESAGDPNLQAVNLHRVVTDELTKRRSTFEAAEFVVNSRIPESYVRANDLLASVFRNLLNNAVQHNNSESPCVEITVREHAETIVSTVADNGPGIPQAHREAVLGRTEEGLEHPAAGLGLYLVDILVTQYDGAVQITDADLGGARVEVELQKASVTGVSATDNAS